MLLGIFLSACGSVAIATPVPGTTPCAPENNAYVIPISQNLIDLYENGVKSIGDPTAYNNIRQQAFNGLVNLVYYLSDSVDIQSGEKTIRITVTYISPELVHTIIVNHYLYKRYTNFSGKLNEQVLIHMSRIIGRNEYVFFMTFMASSYTNNTTSIIKFPLKQLDLTNTNNANIIPAHDDHILENPITLINGPEYGFFYFPMASIQNGTCQAVLDKNYDTRIVLSVPSIVINDTDVGSRTWEYKYAPLIDMTNVSGLHQNRFSLALPVDQFAPKTSKLTASNLESPDFWVGLARMIWSETTLDQ